MKPVPLDIKWAQVTTQHGLATQLLNLAVRMKQVPRNTHILNWRAEPENEALVQTTWREWREDFPNALLQNQIGKTEKKQAGKKRKIKNL